MSLDLTSNRRVVLAARPQGAPSAESFAMKAAPRDEPRPGQLLCRNLMVSIDPYVRLRMYDRESYAPPLQIGDTIPGRAVARVIKSADDRFTPGDLVVVLGGWQEFCTVDGDTARRIEEPGVPLSTHLGPLGISGFTAYVGIELGEPEAGQTVVVSAAAGAVGSIAGQIAKQRGCRVIGIAGSREKCRDVVAQFGFDDCINYRDADFGTALSKACPDGIDIYFENVGGTVSNATVPLLNTAARIVVCGLISQYNGVAPQDDASLAEFMRTVLVKRLIVRGLIITDPQHERFLLHFRQEMTAWLKQGAVVQSDFVLNGLENAVDAFLQMLEGRNLGKTIVDLSH